MANPLFHLQVREMRPRHARAPVQLANGMELPPVSWDDNVPAPRGRHDQTTYVLDSPRAALRVATEDDTDWDNLDVSEITSLYHFQGSILSVRGSAVDARPDVSWQTLRFDHDSNGLSRLIYAGEHDQLQSLPHDISAPFALFPPHCRREVAWRPATAEQPHLGAIGGQVSGMAGLVALTAVPDDDHVHDALLQTINHQHPNGRWRIAFPNHHPGWEQGRGLVVEVRTTQAQEEALQRYEREPLFNSSNAD